MERQSDIIGEALTVARRADPTVAIRLPELSDVVAFLNILINGCAIVDDEKFWNFTMQPLNDLLAHLETLEHQFSQD